MAAKFGSIRRLINLMLALLAEDLVDEVAIIWAVEVEINIRAVEAIQRIHMASETKGMELVNGDLRNMAAILLSQVILNKEAMANLKDILLPILLMTPISHRLNSSNLRNSHHSPELLAINGKVEELKHHWRF